ncbi:hypothetical protein CA850_26175 [Micromonospora echinospora]|uniref:Uncharacterized protein n=1 Tax=Micromonospora echinospora TaxID=1877 RepID=A0A1C4VMG3_MICEC|nr:hypothetical protein [Micromonospora echinospora]OZV76713.1 hypothetical protein CA850_26175 [Micromonospora echinospora]SCE85187.1 hypothetical protein GA0070618_1394 [Micromonospora echinospora]
MTTDTADPDALRRAARDNGARAGALDHSVRTVRRASASFAGTGTAGAAQVLVGPAGARFHGALGALDAALAAARAAHERVAQALGTVAGPIEDEQRARKVLDRAETRLDEARRQLGAEQIGFGAAAKRASADRAAGLEVPAPDMSGVLRAQREVEEAERAHRRAAERHEDALRDRRRAVRTFVAVCQSAAALAPAIPGAPGAPGAVKNHTVFGPRLLDDLKSRSLPNKRRGTGGRNLTDAERRRLARNGLSPREPLFSLLYGSRTWQGAWKNYEKALLKGRNGSVDAQLRLLHRLAMAEGGLGRVGKDRYGTTLNARAEVTAFDARLKAKLRAGGFGAEGELRGRGGADASGGLDLNAGRSGGRLRAEAEAFAGLRGSARGEVDVLGVRPRGVAEGQIGVGASAGVDAGVDGGKVKVQASVGLALGLGGKITVGGEVDVPKIADHIGDGAKAVADVAGKLNPF